MTTDSCRLDMRLPRGWELRPDPEGTALIGVLPGRLPGQVRAWAELRMLPAPVDLDRVRPAPAPGVLDRRTERIELPIGPALEIVELRTAAGRRPWLLWRYRMIATAEAGPLALRVSTWSAALGTQLHGLGRAIALEARAVGRP